MTAEKDTVFFLLTNIPGSGKSTVGRAISQVAEENSLSTYTINEFDLFGEWITKHINEVTWDSTEDGRIVNLTQEQYVAVFDHVAERMVEEFLAHYKEVDIIISEAARDVAGINYMPLFQYLIDALGEKTDLGEKIDFVNLDVYVNDIKELKRRVLERGKRQPNSASVAVVNLYLKEAKDYPHSTSGEAAAQFPENFIYNAEINNSVADDKAIEDDKIPDHIIQKIEGIMAQVLAVTALGTNSNE